ncbi:OmpH family outer membrane protein [Veronia pacifica]|uniref:Chaperone protein skp n=1 Tax=Veronia pacifica TaxID=1080227 RepID=A0A1C3EI82_9GAMM|nr:OmpH family outer membrane protein [Veronia pacifica]ODA32945.1 molecular chaperone [Veronia pacifica]
MKKIFKAAGLSSLLLLGMVFTQTAYAAQKVGYVMVEQVLDQIAQKNKVSEKLQSEFKGRVAELTRLKTKLEKGVQKLKRDGELMSEKDRVKLQRDLQSMDADYKLKVKAIQEDQRKRGLEEENKLIKKVKAAIDKVAKREGYDVVVDAKAILFASPADNLSEKVIRAVRK